MNQLLLGETVYSTIINITKSPHLLTVHGLHNSVLHVIGLQLVQCGIMAYPSSANNSVYGSYLISIRSV